jgi:hypothetical protein
MNTEFSQPLVLRVSLRVYRILLVSYPKSFQHEYAGPMLQAFGDYSRQILLRRGLPGILWWWTITLFDYLVTVVEEHTQRKTTMTKEKLIRFGGWALMLAGIDMVIAFSFGALYETPFGRTWVYEVIDSGLWILALIFFAIGFTALRHRYQDHLGALGKFSVSAAPVLASISAVGILVGQVFKLGDLAWFAFILGIMLMALATVLFGLDALKLQLLPRWHSIPLVAGALPLIVLVLSSLLNTAGANQQIFDVLFPIVLMAWSAGTIALGYLLQSGSQVGETK